MMSEHDLERFRDRVAGHIVGANNMVQPEGWKLVPVEPTREMWDAVNKLDDQCAAGNFDGKGCSIEQAWDCMLAAAPQQPAPQPEESAVLMRAYRTSDAYEIGYKDGQKSRDGCGRCHDNSKPCDIGGCVAPQQPAPQPCGDCKTPSACAAHSECLDAPQQPAPQPTERQRFLQAYEKACKSSMPDDWMQAALMAKQWEQAAPQQPAPQPCHFGGQCEHVGWCSETYCQEQCKFTKEQP